MKKSPQYSVKQKTIHWLTAILVFIIIVFPLMRTSVAQYVGGMGTLFTIHKSFGVMIFFITLWRIYVIIKQGVPEVLPKDERLQRIVSKSVQGILYLLLLILPLSGYLMSSRPLNFLGIISIPAIEMPNTFYVFFHSVHIITAYALIALIALHMFAALYHHFWVKDKVLKSMLPERWFD